MSETDYRVLENRIRRLARRRGLKLEKSRARDPRAADYTTYQLVDASSGSVVARGFASGYGMSLADVAASLLATPIALLADEFAARGYEVELGKNFGGEMCQILADPNGHPIAINVIDFGRDPLGRSVDIRWESHGQPHFIDTVMETEKLGDRIIETF